MYRLAISLVVFALLVTATPGSILAADITVSYPVGESCVGPVPACGPGNDFVVSHRGAGQLRRRGST